MKVTAVSFLFFLLCLGWIGYGGCAGFGGERAHLLADFGSKQNFAVCNRIGFGGIFSLGGGGT